MGMSPKNLRELPPANLGKQQRKEKHMKTMTRIMYPIFGLFAFASFALSPVAQAVGPDTEGNIPGSNNGEGIGVLVNRTSGLWNTGTGFQALNHLTAGNQNTATGFRALFSDTNGGFNTATGVFSLFSNTSGFFNSAAGAYALANNIEGDGNTASGYGALYRNTADGNTANGFAALYRNTTGFFNTAIGNVALYGNTTGDRNTAIGSRALESNTTGVQNTATGRSALAFNTTGVANTADGYGALFNNTTGWFNTAEGNSALVNSTTGDLNTALGFVAAGNLTTGDNNIAIANLGVAAESDTIRIGMEVAAMDEYGNLHPAHTATYIAGISGQTASGGVAVYINSDGKLGTLTSSARFKTEIKPMDKASEAILALKPVTFHYKGELDPDGIPQFGLVAEEVEKVNPDLVARDAEGKVYTVRYEAVNAMLLNEFLKAHRRMEEQEATISHLKSTVAKHEATDAEQQKAINTLSASLNKQASQIQKVSAQLQLQKPPAQTVVNNQ
jgi:hypothetical protein